VALRRAGCGVVVRASRSDRAGSSRPSPAGRRMRGPFAFEPELEYAEGIARFLTGTPNVPRSTRARPATT
jgi:hypothetical protein